MNLKKVITVISTFLIIGSGYFFYTKKEQTTKKVDSVTETELKQKNKNVSVEKDIEFEYDSIKYIKANRFPVDRAPKSVIATKDGSKVYALCLEELSVIEINTSNYRRTRTLKFKPTEGVGFDYSKRKWVKSIQEKPVEAVLTHNERFLWISLHNADGVCVWDLKNNNTFIDFKENKKVKIIENETTIMSQIAFFETETTPKFIVEDTLHHRLYVTNWHDDTCTVINIKGGNPSNWKTIKHFKTKATPRGLSIDYINNRLWIGNMGSHNISVYDLKSLNEIKTIKNVQSPRHFVSFDSIIYLSQSSKEIISAYDINRFTKKFEMKTADDPRSIALSKNGQFLFSTAYADNLLEVFDLKNKKKLFSLPSNGGPVGITLIENKEKLQAWVCNYKFSTIKVFHFTLK